MDFNWIDGYFQATVHGEHELSQPRLPTLANLRRKWVGVDVGLVSDPTRVLVFGELAQGAPTLELHLTIHQAPASAIAELLRKFSSRWTATVAVDCGLGLPVARELKRWGVDVVEVQSLTPEGQASLAQWDELGIAYPHNARLAAAAAARAWDNGHRGPCVRQVEVPPLSDSEIISLRGLLADRARTTWRW